MLGCWTKVGVSVAFAAMAGSGGYSWTDTPFNKNDPFTVGPYPAIVRAGSVTNFAAYGEGYKPKEFEWLMFWTEDSSLTPDGVFTAGSPLNWQGINVANQQAGLSMFVKINIIPETVAVVFASDASGRNEIWSINDDGSELQQLTSEGAESVFTTNDDNAIFYRTSEGIRYRGYWGEEFLDGLYIPKEYSDKYIDMSNRWYLNGSGYPAASTRLIYDDFGGGEEFAMIRNGASGVIFLYHTAQDVSSLAFRGKIFVFSMGTPDHHEIFRLNGFLEAIPVTSGKLDCADLTAGSDSRTVFFSGFDGKQWDIYSVDLRTEKVSNLTRSPKFDERSPFVSPEGRSIIYSRSDGDVSDIYVMDIGGQHKRALVSGMGKCITPFYMGISIPASP